MRRSVPLLLTCLLALATGIALLGAGALVPMPARETALTAGSPGDSEANAALIRRFYDAVNTTIGNGDTGPLTNLVAADFADRAAHPGHAPTRDGLVRQILTLRATFPAMWLVVEDVSAHGDLALARVRVEGATSGTFLGVPFSGEPAAWAGLDVYRVTGGRIVERWATGDWPVMPQPLVRVPLPAPPAGAILRLARLTFAPGAHQRSAGALGPLLVAVKTGTLTVRVDGPAALTRGEGVTSSDPRSTDVSPGTDVALGPGDGLLVASLVPYVVRNAGQLPAVVLALALLPWSDGAPSGDAFRWPESDSPDVTAQRLADVVIKDLPNESATIALGWVTLATRAELRTIGATGPRLAVVEAGALQLAPIAGPTTTLSAGQGTTIEPASSPTLRNVGDVPLVVLLVTITPTAPAD